MKKKSVEPTIEITNVVTDVTPNKRTKLARNKKLIVIASIVLAMVVCLIGIFIYKATTNNELEQSNAIVDTIAPSISVNENDIDMKVGESTTIIATVNGKEQVVEWTSADETVAKVDNGKVTANKEGSTTVTAKANGIETTVKVEVTTAEQQETTSKKNTTTSTTTANTTTTKKNGSSSSSSTSTTKHTTATTKQTTTTKPSTTKATTTTTQKQTTTTAKWCVEGGSKHVIDKGIGWYSSYNEAEQAALNILAEDSTLERFEVQQCDCGLYTAYVK